MLNSLSVQHIHIQQIAQKQHSAFGATNATIFKGQHKHQQKYRKQKTDQQIVGQHGIVVDAQGTDQRSKAQYRPNIENIGTDDVAHRNIVLFSKHGNERSGQLRHTGPEGHDRNPNDPVAHAPVQCQGFGPFHQPFGTNIQASHRQNNEAERLPQQKTGGQKSLPLSGGLAARLPNRPQNIQHQSQHKSQTLPKSNGPIVGKEHQQQGGQHHYYPIKKNAPILRNNRYHHGYQPQNEPDIGNIGTHHIAHRQIRNAIPGRLNTDKKLRCRSPEGHHGKTNNQSTDPKPTRERHTALYEPVATQKQQNQSQNKPNKGHKKIFSVRITRGRQIPVAVFLPAFLFSLLCPFYSLNICTEGIFNGS